MKIYKTVLAVFLLFSVIYYSFQIQNISKLRQENLIEHSEIRSIKYGLLSVYEWKRQVSQIIAVKVKNFKLTASNRENIRENIYNILYNIIDELDKILESKANQGGIFSGAIKRFIQSLFFDVNAVSYTHLTLPTKA